MLRIYSPPCDVGSTCWAHCYIWCASVLTQMLYSCAAILQPSVRSRPTLLSYPHLATMDVLISNISVLYFGLQSYWVLHYFLLVLCWCEWSVAYRYVLIFNLLFISSGFKRILRDWNFSPIRWDCYYFLITSVSEWSALVFTWIHALLIGVPADELMISILKMWIVHYPLMHYMHKRRCSTLLEVAFVG